LASNSIESRHLASDAVDANAVMDLAISANKLADNTVTGPKFGKTSIKGSHVVPGAVGVGKVKANSVSGDVIASGALSSDHVAKDAVARGKLADGAISSAHIKDDSVSLEHFAASTITNDKIQTNAIIEEKIADGSIIGDNLVDSAVTSDKIALKTIGWQHFTIGVFDMVQDAVLKMGSIEKKLRTLKSRCLADETAQKNMRDLVTLHRGVYLLERNEDHSVYCSGPEGGAAEIPEGKQPVQLLFERMSNFHWGLPDAPKGSKHFGTQGLSKSKELPKANSAVSVHVGVWCFVLSLFVLVLAW